METQTETMRRAVRCLKRKACHAGLDVRRDQLPEDELPDDEKDEDEEIDDEEVTVRMLEPLLCRDDPHVRDITTRSFQVRAATVNERAAIRRGDRSPRNRRWKSTTGTATK